MSTKIRAIALTALTGTAGVAIAILTAVQPCWACGDCWNAGRPGHSAGMDCIPCDSLAKPVLSPYGIFAAAPAAQPSGTEPFHRSSGR